MSFPNLFSGRKWLLFPLCAAFFVVVTDRGRIRQADMIRNLDRADANPVADYAGGRHWLVVPEHHTPSYQWMVETQQMLEGGEWRIRHTDRENAPDGRPVHTASPYRWWLGLLAWIDHQVTGQPTGLAVEQAVLWSGPCLHVLFLLAGTAYAAGRFGAKPAALLALGLAVLYPLAGEFAPGVADDHGLAVMAALAGLLGLVGGLRGHRPSFILAGIAGGLGLWVSAATQVPVLAAIGLGALGLAVYERLFPAKSKEDSLPPLPWNRWALAGAVTSLLAYMAEYYPGHMELRLQVNHPLYAIAWLGLGQLLTLAEAWRTGRAGRDRRTLFTALAALAGLAAVPVAMKLTDSPGFLVPNPSAARLSNLLNGPVAPNLALWLSRDGLTLALAATGLPFALLGPGILQLLAKEARPAARRTAVFAGGILLVGLVAACVQLQGWTLAQAMLLVLLVGAFPPEAPKGWLAIALALLPGLVLLAETARPRDETRLTRLEIEGLIDRDVAHWLADHAGADGATVLVSPERTPALNFYGGLRGLGSPNWENRDGVAVTVQIIDANTAEQAQAQLAKRGVTHLVLASWDTDLDEFVRWTQSNPNDTFLAALRRWALPPWVQPLPYRLPAIAGFEDQSVVILKVTDNADQALAQSRLAEYALDVEDTALAKAAARALEDFPASLAALIGRAHVAKATNDSAAFDPVFATLQQTLKSGLDRLLPWDRRLSLAVVLAQGGRNDLAKPQLQRCLAELDDARLRSLGANAIYRLLVLAKAFDLGLKPELRDHALALLPAEARARL